MRRITTLTAAVLLTLGALSCQTEKPRNVILLIGDGMGIQQLSLLFYFASKSDTPLYPDKKSFYEKFSENSRIMMMLTNPADVIVTDSACSATQLATGKLSGSEMIGLDAKGQKALTIIEKARSRGLATGLISDTRITHATPAAFASHRAHRSMENEIAEDLLEIQPDVMLSAGTKYLLPSDAEQFEKESPRIAEKIPPELLKSGSRKDNKNLLQKAADSGYELVFTKDQMMKAKGPKIFGLFAPSAMMDGPAWFHSKDKPDRTEPSLSEMTKQALEVLSKNKKGFFLMVEAGQIDWAGHNNDSGMLLYDMLKMDETLKVIADFAEKRNDTVVIVTADHETGGFGFSYHNADLPEPKKLDSEYFAEVPFLPDYNFIKPDVLGRIAAQKESCFSILKKFDSLQPGEKSNRRLAELLTDNYGTRFSERDAAEILSLVPNPRFDPNRKSVKEPKITPISDFSDFYPYADGRRCAVIARKLAVYHGIVWATGTHTATPVPLMVRGPSSVYSYFREMMHSSEAGDAMQKILGLN